jgi:hypothetical protein
MLDLGFFALFDLPDRLLGRPAQVFENAADMGGVVPPNSRSINLPTRAQVHSSPHPFPANWGASVDQQHSNAPERLIWAALRAPLRHQNL